MDSLRYHRASGGVRADLLEGVVRAGYGGRASVTGIEILFGSPQDDVIRGSHRVNVFIGFRGSDLLVGRGGRDELLAGGGDDRCLSGEVLKSCETDS